MFRLFFCGIGSFVAGLMVLFSVVLITSNAYAQVGSKSLTLKEAVARTLQNNPQLHQYAFRAQGLAGQRDMESLAPAMTVDVALEGFGGGGSHSGFDSTESTLALASVLEFGSKRKARVSVADAHLNTLQYEREVKTLDILGRVTFAFIHALETQESILLAKEVLSLSREAFSTVQGQAQRGAASEAEIKRASAALAQADVQLNALSLRFERESMVLSTFWRGMIADFSHLKGNLFDFGAGAEFSVLYKKAKLGPGVGLFSSKSRLKDAQVQLARTKSRSDVGWMLGVRHYEDSGDSALVAGVSMPLFSGKRNQGGVKVALVERDQFELQYREALLNLHSQLYAAYSQRKQFVYAVEKSKKDIIPSLERALILYQEAYENGRYSYQEWVIAQQELITAKQMLIQNASSALLNQAIIDQLTSQSVHSK